MPNNQGRNIDSYQMPEGRLNEFEFSKHHGEMTREERSSDLRAEDARADAEDNLEAEQESAEAMDAEVPDTPDSDKTTEGQPS